MFRRLFQSDWVLTITICLLSAVGLATIYSIGINREPPTRTPFFHQLVAVGIGLVILVGATLFTYRFWKSYAFILYIIGIILLLAVLFFGTEIGGTRGWILIGPLSFQPTEIAKVCTLLFLAQYLSRQEQSLDRLATVISSGVIVALAVGLLLLQPDLGSAITLVAVWLGLLAILHTRRQHLLIIVGGLIAVALIAWLFLLAPYQRERIRTFLDPGSDPLGQGYNVSQSIIAVGSGMLTGRGLGLGPQSQLNFLPTQETDFIFAVIAEELGFLGAAILVILYAILFWRLGRIVRRERDTFALLVVASTLGIIVIQMGINIGMNLGVLPVTGLPLPLVSLAGTSLLATFFLLGIVQNITTQQSAIHPE